MTEQSPSAIGTVAQEAARLIEEMATMAHSGYSRGDDPSRYAGESDQERVGPNAWHVADATPDDAAKGSESGASEATGEPGADACSMCGAQRGADRDGTPASCRLCPLCRGIALLRSVRPETVDLLADLAISVAATLRDAATRSRASGPTSCARPTSGGPPDPGGVPVQDIHVDDESER